MYEPHGKNDRTVSGGPSTAAPGPGPSGLRVQSQSEICKSPLSDRQRTVTDGALSVVLVAVWIAMTAALGVVSWTLGMVLGTEAHPDGILDRPEAFAEAYWLSRALAVGGLSVALIGCATIRRLTVSWLFVLAPLLTIALYVVVSYAITRDQAFRAGMLANGLMLAPWTVIPVLSIGVSLPVFRLGRTVAHRGPFRAGALSSLSVLLATSVACGAAWFANHEPDSAFLRLFSAALESKPGADQRGGPARLRSRLVAYQELVVWIELRPSENWRLLNWIGGQFFDTGDVDNDDAFPSCLNDLYLREYEQIGYRLRRDGLTPDDQHDLFMTVVIKVCQREPPVEIHERGAYLQAAVTNAVRDGWRREHVRRVCPIDGDNANWAPRQETSVELDRVMRQICALPDAQHRALLLSVTGHTHADIATLLGVSVEQSRRLVSDARRTLRRAHER